MIPRAGKRSRSHSRRAASPPWRDGVRRYLRRPPSDEGANGRSGHAGAPPPDAATRGLRRYIAEFDVMRGAAILWVIFLHADFGLWPSTSAPEALLVHALRIVADGAVPVFLYMSGFLLARDSAPDARTYARRRTRRILLPTLFWMTAILAWNAWRGGGSGSPVRDFVTFNVSGQYYYLAVLLALMVVVYPLRWWSPRRLGGAATVAFAANLAMIAFYQWHGVHGARGLDGSELAYRNPLAWVFFYVFGLYVARRRGAPAWSARAALAAGGGMAACMAVYLLRGALTGYYPESYFGVTVFLSSACALVVYPSVVAGLQARRRAARLLAPLEALGPYAFAIFLVHKPFFIGALSTRVFLGRLPTDYLELVAGLYVVGGGAAIAAVVAAARLGGRPARAVLGIDDARRRRAGRDVMPSEPRAA